MTRKDSGSKATHPAAVATPRSCGVCSTKAFIVDDGMHWVPSTVSSVQRPMANSVWGPALCAGVDFESSCSCHRRRGDAWMYRTGAGVTQHMHAARAWHIAPMPNQLELRLPCTSPLASSCVLRPTRVLRPMRMPAPSARSSNWAEVNAVGDIETIPAIGLT